MRKKEEGGSEAPGRDVLIAFYIRNSKEKGGYTHAGVLPRHPGEHFRVCAGYAPIAFLDPVYLI